MKNSFNWLLLFLCIQIQNADAQLSNFYKEFTVNQVELSLYSIDTVYDGGYITLGSYENANGGNAIVIRTDSLGNELWRKRNEYFTSLDSTNAYLNIKGIENGFLLSGYIRILDSLGIFNNQYLLTKIDTAGNTVWEKIFGDSSHERFQSLVVNDDSSFFLSGLRTPGIPNQLSVYKFDFAGNLLWDSLFAFSQNLILNSIVKRYSDTLVFALTLKDSLTLLQHSGVLVLNTEGGFIDSLFLPSTVSSRPLDVTKAGNKYYLIERRGNSGTNSQIVVLDSALNIFSTSDFAPLIIGSLDKNLNIFSCNFDSLTSLVSTSMVNEFGDTLWKSLLNEQYAFPNYIVNEGGCAVVCGRVDQDNTTIAKGFLLKVCDSLLINNVLEFSQTKNDPLSIVQGSNMTQIIINEEFLLTKNKITISIFDLTGKLINEKQNISSEILELHNEQYSRGVYIIVLTSNNIFNCSKKIVFN